MVEALIVAVHYIPIAPPWTRPRRNQQPTTFPVMGTEMRKTEMSRPWLMIGNLMCKLLYLIASP